VESDWSSASYWLVASALGHEVKCVGLSMDSNQADKAILDAFVAANCAVIADENGIVIDGTQRTSFAFDATHCPDLFPALVTFAAFCSGTSRIRGVHRLRHKESDRASALVNEFSKLGVNISIVEDALVITGRKRVLSEKVDSHNDHRIAMCLAIAGLYAEDGVEITGAEAVSKSYPDFWNDFDSLFTQ
jgi:3-phosphoshikimate 1-carboxyvinyltransferase